MKTGNGCSKILLIAVFLSSICFAYDWQTNPGDGSPTNPYQISEPNQLIAIGSNADLLNKCYILVNDIDLSGYTFTVAVMSPHTSTTTGYQGTEFTGCFDGSGHSISDLTITGGSYLGLFGYIDPAGTVINLNLDGMEIISAGQGVGGLCGYNEGRITNCSASGMVNGTNNVGGLTGRNLGTLTACYSVGTVVSGNGSYLCLGGLCGYNSGSITNCYSAGSVTGGGSYARVGGLCGYNSGPIANCFSTSAVADGTFGGHLGGLCGFNAMGFIRHCYATGLITGGGSPGGLVGYHLSVRTENCFWDTQTSGTTVGVGLGPSAGVYGRTTQQMQQQAIFTDSGWDFVNTWWILEGESYPALSLSWEVPDKPWILAVPGQTAFASSAEGIDPPVQELTLVNIGGAELHWQITEECPWLQATPMEGTCSPGREDVVVLVAEVNDLVFDNVFSCELTVSDPNAGINTFTIPVSLFYTADCYNPLAPAYADWLAFGKPDCWCYEHNCYGDADGKLEGSIKSSFRQVYLHDLNILTLAYNIPEPPKGDGIANLVVGDERVPAICADFDRDQEGSTKTGFKRVYLHDLNILTITYAVSEPIKGPGVPLCPLTSAGGDIVYYKYPE